MAKNNKKKKAAATKNAKPKVRAKLIARKPAAKKPAPKQRTAKKLPAKKLPAKKAAAKKSMAAGEGGSVRTGIARLGLIIAHAKRDLAALQAQEIGRTHLPTAGDELSAIVGATENATNAILDAVERIEKMARDLPGEAAASITQEVTTIYEACNFQDITGQRISKVVSVLKAVDTTVAELLSTLHMPKIDLSQTSAGSAKPERTGDAALLNGPQAPGGAPNQADIDAMFDKA
jgi:chemotaxis protein CheZ